MNIPTDPLKISPIPPSQTSAAPSSQVPASAAKVGKNPTEVWQKFLGPTATPEQIQKFMDGLCKTIADQIKQQQKIMKKAAEELDKSTRGES